MSASGFHFNFDYKNQHYQLVDYDPEKHDNQKGVRVVNFKGKQYAILGKPDALYKINDLFRSISFKATDTEKDFERKLKAATNPPPHLKRRLSAQELGQEIQEGGVFTLEQEKMICQEKSSTMWECTGRKPDKLSQGYIYTLELREKYDDLSPRLVMPSGSREWSDEVMEANREVNIAETTLFPAAERLYGEAALRQAIFSEPDRFRLAVKKISGFSDFLREFGYDWKHENGKLLLMLPDRETLLAHWARVFSEKPALTILGSVGVATNVSFIEAFFTHDLLLSTGKEFTHDHIYHVVPLLNSLCQLDHMSITVAVSDTQLESVSLRKVIQDELKGTDAASDLRLVLHRAVASYYQPLLLAKQAIRDGKAEMSADEIAMCETLVGAITDGLSNLDSWAKIESKCQNQIKEIKAEREGRKMKAQDHPDPYPAVLLTMNDARWLTYFERQFPKVPNIREAVLNAWEKTLQIAAKTQSSRP